jgi:inosose dehydratase
MVTRREFLWTGLGLAAAVNTFALPSDKFRWSISSHEFTPLKPQPDQGIKIAARFGFHGLEPFAEDMPQYLKQPPEVFKRVLDEAGISISTIGSGGQYFDRVKLPATIENNAANAKFAAAMGCKVLKANMNARPGPETLTSANAKVLAANLNEVGKRTLEHGIKFALHPHAWTMVERKPEVDMILEMTDPKLVYITLDTCHASVGGIDPVKFLNEHYGRVAHMHFKDTLPVWSPVKGWQGPAPSKEEEVAMARKLGLPPTPDPIYQRLGTGGVDFPALIQILRAHNYDGWISLDFNAAELYPGVTIEQDMAAHRKYLLETLHAALRS